MTTATVTPTPTPTDTVTCDDVIRINISTGGTGQRTNQSPVSAFIWCLLDFRFQYLLSDSQGYVYIYQ